MWEDPIVAEVRQIRGELSAKLDYDVQAIFADLRNRQAALGERLVQPRRDSKVAPVDTRTGNECR